MKIPGYKIQRMIGKGGTSTVYLAVQESLGRRVALKVLKKFDDQKHAERFLHEGRIIASLNHRNIITIHDIGTIGDRHFISMEYLEGRSLTERIDEGMPLPRILSLLEQMAACLHFVHSKGIIHRDIKPSNILFHADGTPKLTDFGIAKLLDSDQELTMDGSALGSPYYLSPEQAEGLPLDGRSDVYALGIVFYQMLTGQKPYAKSSPIETIVAHLTQPIPVLPDPLLGFQALLERMIAKRPEDRVGSAKELVYLIRESKEVGPHRADPASWQCGRFGSEDRRSAPIGLRRPPRAQAVTAGLSALFVGALLFAIGNFDATQDTGKDQLTAVDGTPTAAASPAEPQASPLAPNHATGPRQVTAPALTQQPPLTEEPAEPPVVAQAEITVMAADQATTTAEQWTVAAIAAPPEPWIKPQPQDESINPLGEAAVNAVAVAAVESDAMQIDEWMRAAELAMQRYRLTTPADDNALGYYQKILARDPDHPGARSGVQEIADRYAALARRALRKDRDQAARVYLQRGLEVQPGDRELTALLDDIDTRAHQRTVVTNTRVERVAATVADSRPVEDGGNRSRTGSGNIVKDFKNVWRSIFN